MPPAPIQNQEQRPALRITLSEDRRKIPRGLRAAGYATDFKPGGETLAQIRSGKLPSGGVALIRPQQHRRKRIAAPSAAHLIEGWGVPGDPADRGEGLEMLRARVGRR